MTRIRSLLAVGVAAACLWPTPTTAGGWWNHIDLDSPHLAVGESLSFRQPVTFWNISAARRALSAERAATEAYAAYLMGHVDQAMLDRAMSTAEPGQWWEPPTDLVRVGDVELMGSDSNLVRATVRLSVPDMPPGTYYMMLCDVGCRTPLGDIVPTAIRLTDEPFAARALRLIERYRAHFDSKLLRIDRLARKSLSRTLDAEQDIAELKARVGALSSEIESLRHRPAPGPWGPVAAGAAGGSMVVLTGALGMMLLRRRRGAIAVPVVPDDARQLVDEFSATVRRSP